MSCKKAKNSSFRKFTTHNLVPNISQEVNIVQVKKGNGSLWTRVLRLGMGPNLAAGAEVVTRLKAPGGGGVKNRTMNMTMMVGANIASV